MLEFLQIPANIVAQGSNRLVGIFRVVEINIANLIVGYFAHSLICLLTRIVVGSLDGIDSSDCTRITPHAILIATIYRGRHGVSHRSPHANRRAGISLLQILQRSKEAHVRLLHTRYVCRAFNANIFVKYSITSDMKLFVDIYLAIKLLDLFRYRFADNFICYPRKIPIIPSVKGLSYI